MKKNILLILIVILNLSCSEKEEIEPISQGMLEEFLLQNSEIIIEPINESNLEYIQKASKRGFYFKPLVDIEITAIGGCMPKTGEYEIEILQSHSDWGLLHENEPVIVSESLNVINQGKFQYTELNNNIILKANKRYVLRYFNENNESIFDVILPSSYQESNTESYLHPQEIPNIEIEMIYYSYFNEIDGEYKFDIVNDKINAGGHIDTDLFLRGIPDIKYNLK